MKIAQVSFGGVVSAFVLLASCTVPPRTPTHPGEVAEMCHASCKERQRCGGRGDEAKCESYCEEHGSKWRDYYRKDYVDSMSQCFDTISCDVAHDERQRRGTCIEATKPTPTQKAQDVCTLMIERMNDCGHYLSKVDYDMSRCLRSVGLLDDDMLEGIRECTKLSCVVRRKYSPWECLRDLSGSDTLP